MAHLQGSINGGAATCFQDLGMDILLRVASYSGRSAPALSRTCQATRHLWQGVRQQAELLAQVLVDTQPASADALPQGTDALKAALEMGLTRTMPDLDAFRTLLTAGADVHKDQDAALCRAVTEGRTAAVKLLLEHGADVCGGGNTALVCTARRGDVATAQVLLAYGADVHANGEAALCRALYFGHQAMAELLLAHGADARRAQINCELLVDWALRIGGTALAAKLLNTDALHAHSSASQDGADAQNGRDQDNQGDQGSSERLLDRPAVQQVIKRHVQRDTQQLQDTLRTGQLGAARKLLRRSDADLGGCNGLRLGMAALWRKREVVALLREHGADARVRWNGMLCL